MPVAVIVKAPGWLEHPVQLAEAWFHVGYISGDIFKPVTELPFAVFVCCSIVLAVGIKGRVDVDEVDAFGGEGLQLDETVPAVDDAGLHGFNCITRDIARVGGIKYN